jgi:DNA sulfur modification protein DndB
MVRLRDIPAFFVAVDASLSPEHRAQRTLNKARIPKIAQYILGNPRDYTFGALVGAIDGLPTFEPAEGQKPMGLLHIPRSMTVAVLDGQHRRAAIETAVREDNARKKGGSLGDESIAVILFVDNGLEKSQQKFADLNRFAMRPTGSIGLLYDHRDEMAALTKAVVAELPIFTQLTDAEKTGVAGGSVKLFTLAALHAATKALLSSSSYKAEEAKKIAVAFWSEIARWLPAWQEVANGTRKASELRETCVHAHAVALHALGRVGNALLREPPETWNKTLKRLTELDWSRSNDLWAGRATANGRMMKNTASVVLTGNVIKTHLGLKLGIEDRRFESLLDARA